MRRLKWPLVGSREFVPMSQLRLCPLRMTMNVSYLSHMEQLTVNAFEYIDCGSNSTTPHPVR